MNLLSAFGSMFRGKDHDWLEAHLSAQNILWGIWYLLPFNVFSHVPSARNLSAFFPEWVWGLFFLALGCSQFFLVIHPHMFLKVRKLLSLFSVFLWLMITALALYGNPYAPAVPTTALFALANALIYFKMKAIQNTITPHE